MQCWDGPLLNCPFPPTLAFSTSNVAPVWITAMANYSGFEYFYPMKMFQ